MGDFMDRGALPGREKTSPPEGGGNLTGPAGVSEDIERTGSPLAYFVLSSP